MILSNTDNLNDFTVFSLQILKDMSAHNEAVTILQIHGAAQASFSAQVWAKVAHFGRVATINRCRNIHQNAGNQVFDAQEILRENPFSNVKSNLCPFFA